MALDIRLVQELLALRNRLRDALEHGESSHPAAGLWPEGAGLEPAVDVWESAEELVVEVELPGARPGDISLRLDDRVLIVTGVLPTAAGEDARYLRMERPRGAFSRHVPLPGEVIGEPRAILRNGVLRVHLPKAAASQRRTIPVHQEGP